VADSLPHFYNRLGKLSPADRRIYTCIRQTGKDVLSHQARVVAEDFAFRLSSGQKFQNELDGESRPADHRLTRQDLGVNHNALRQRL
jgi:hypothetical protein